MQTSSPHGSGTRWLNAAAQLSGVTLVLMLAAAGNDSDGLAATLLLALLVLTGVLIRWAVT